jgi:hypothetical protein
MSDKPSLPEMLEDLERRVAFHREQEERHARQEESHREERARHAAALAQAAQQLATLQAAASVAAALVQEAAPPEEPAEPEEPIDEGLRMISRMVALVVQRWPAGKPFGASDVAAVVDRRFGARLRGPVSVATVSANLRRLCKKGALRQRRPGVAHAEALYDRIDPRG